MSEVMNVGVMNVGQSSEQLEKWPSIFKGAPCRIELLAELILLLVIILVEVI